MKSQKQKEQSHGYARDAIIRSLLSHYKIKLEELSIEELEQKLYAEEATIKFKETPFDGGSLLSIGLEQAIKKPIHTDTLRPSDEEIKTLAESLIKQARLAGHTITPKAKSDDVTEERRLTSKWERHQRFTEDLEAARRGTH